MEVKNIRVSILDEGFSPPFLLPSAIILVYKYTITYEKFLVWRHRQLGKSDYGETIYSLDSEV